MTQVEKENKLVVLNKELKKSIFDMREINKTLEEAQKNYNIQYACIIQLRRDINELNEVL